MRLPRLSLLALASVAALAACTAPNGELGNNPNPAPAGNETVSAPQLPAADVPTRLRSHVWHLRDAKAADGSPISALMDTPGRMLGLRIDEDRIGLLNGCNHMGGSVRIQADTLEIGDITSTMMACDDRRLMDMDRTVARVLQGSMGMQLGGGQSPTLTLTSKDGEVLMFEGEPTDASRYGSEGETVFLEVAPDKVACADAMTPDKQCLQVRELEYDDNGLRRDSGGEFTAFHDVIQGFEHEPGMSQVLRVKRYDIANPQPSGPRQAWVLDMVVESGTAKP